ncbi:sigma-70 family RNA polymerase sigma factor [Streptomyces sp. NPDC059651]|uniref:sigma-70 family RNA polymerase sigma factor n=1 Tax=Streptomyces sp. NPDC059651 TaxID=3346897 RepID=UPI00368A90CC
MTTQASPKIAPPGAEPALVSAARTGNATAFGDLYTEHRGPVYRYILSRVRDSYLAEDLTSETFLRAYRRIDSFAWQGTDIGAWLVTIARNIVIDHVRLTARRPEVTTDDIDFLDQSEGSAEVSALAAFDGAPVRHALDTLLPDHRQVIVLQSWSGLSCREVAAVMHRSEGAVKTLRFRAMANLRRALQNYEVAA